MKNWSPEKEINKNTEGIKNWPTGKIIDFSVNGLLEMHRGLEKAADQLEAAADLVVKTIGAGGKVVTIGAGGSGVAGMSVMRELPQNHEDIGPDKFGYIVAGGAKIFEPFGCEELEDDQLEGQTDVQRANLGKSDLLICISATGRTPYTRGAAEEARSRGAKTAALICQVDTELEGEVDLPVVLEIGPEMFQGATCEKAASAQKAALDAIFDAVVVRLGYTDDNRTRARLVHEKARIRQRFFSERSA